ncbi:uncharacterized protein DAT39_015819, partial [Clarias magur]
EPNHEASGSLASSPDQATPSTSSLQPSGLLMIDENPASVTRSDSTSRQGDLGEMSLSGTAEKPQITLHLGSTVESPARSSAEGPIRRAEPSFMIPSTAVVHIRNQSSTSGLDFSTHTATSFVRSQPQSHTIPPVATDIMTSYSLPPSSASTATPAFIPLLLPSLSSSDSTSLWSPSKKTKPAHNHSHLSGSVPVSTTPTTLDSDKHRSLKNTSNDTYIELNKPFVQNPFITTHLMVSPTIHKNPISPEYKSFLKQPTRQNVTSYLNWDEPYTNHNSVSLGLYRQYLTTQVTSLNSLLATVKSQLFAPVSFSGLHLSGSTEKPRLSNFLQKSVSFSEHIKPKNVFSMPTSSAFMKYTPRSSLHEIRPDRTPRTHGTKEMAKSVWNVAPTNIPSIPLMVHTTDTIPSETTARAVALSKPLISAIFSSSKVKQVTDSLPRSMTSILLDRKSLNSQNGIIPNFVTTLGSEKSIQEIYTPLRSTSSENAFSKTITYKDNWFSSIASTSLPSPSETRSFLKQSTFIKGSTDKSFSLTPSVHLYNVTQTNKSDYFRRMPTSPEIFTKDPFFSAQTSVSKDTSTVSPKQIPALGTGAQVLNLTPIRANFNTAGKESSVDSSFYTTLTLKKQEVSTLSPAVIGGFSHRKDPLQQVHVIQPGESFLSISNTNKSVTLNTGSVQELPAGGPASGIDSLSKRTPSVSSPTMIILAVHTSGTQTDLPPDPMELLPASLPTELSSASSPSSSSPASLPSASSRSSLPAASLFETTPSPSALAPTSLPSELSQGSSSRELSSVNSPSKLSPALSPLSSPSSSSVASLLDTATAPPPSELPPVSPLVSSLKDLPTPSLPPELLPLSSPSEFSSPSPLTAPPLPPQLPSASSTSEILAAFSSSSITIASSPAEVLASSSPSSPAALLSSSELSPSASSLSEKLQAPSPSSSVLSSPPELLPVSSPSFLTLASSLSDLPTPSLPPELLPLSSISEILPTSSPSSAPSLPFVSSTSEIPPAFSTSLATASSTSEVLPLSSLLELAPLSFSPLSSMALSPLELVPVSSPLLTSSSDVSSASELSTGTSSSSRLSPILLSETSELLSISPTTTSSILITFTSYYNSVLTKQLTSIVSKSPSSTVISSSSSSRSETLSSKLSSTESPRSELSRSESSLSPSEISPLEFSSPAPPTEFSSPAPPSTSPSELLSSETSLSELPSALLPTEMSPGSSPTWPPSSSLIKLSPTPLPLELSPGSSPSDLAPELSSTASLLSPTLSVFESSPATLPSEESLIASPSELSGSESSPASPPSELSPSPSQLLPSYYDFIITEQPIPLMPVSPSKEILMSSSSLSPSSSSESTSPVISSYYGFLLTKQFTSISPSKISSSSSALSPFTSFSSSAAYNYHSDLTKYSTLSPLTPFTSPLMASTSSEPLFSLPSKPSQTFSQTSALIPSHLSQEVSEPHLVVTEKSTLDQVMSVLPSSVLTSQDTRLHAKGNDSGSPSSQMISPTSINKNGNASVHLELLTQELPVGGSPQLTTITTTTTTASTTTTTTQQTSTSQLTSTAGSTTSATTTTTVKSPKTIVSYTTVSSKWPTTAPRVRTSPPRTTTTTQSSPLSCNITDRMWVKTVLTVHIRRNRLDNILKQNLLKGLTLSLSKALNDSSVRAQIESLSTVPNVTVGYYVTRGDMVYTTSVVVEALISYGLDRLMADIRQFVPMVQAMPIPATPWRSTPAISLMLKTVLRFVGAGDDVRSCSFAQLMEKRLENAFAEAEAKVLNSYSSLSVEILSVSQSAGSPAVSLIYVVRNRTVTLNGTATSNLLSRLTAELVGYFLFYPPLITAEPLEYHNLNTSVATKEFWVITVIQDVENSSLAGQYQSFASLMEERLAELFMVAHQQGARFKRATTVGSYTVQMVGMRRVVGPKNPAELTYYVQLNGTPLPGTTAAKILNTVDSQTMALTLGYFVQLQAEAVVKGPSNNLWIIASVLAPIGIVTIIIIIITAVLCHKNKSDLKTDGIGNLNPRVKTSYRRDMSYYHQPVQGFDYAKQHLGQLGADEDSAPLPQAPLPIRDASLSLDKVIHPDGTNSKKILGGEIRKSSRLPSEDGSAGSVEAARPVSVRGSTAKKITTQQSLMKEESKKRTDPYDTSSGSLQLLSVKPIAAPPAYSQPASSDRSQDSAVLNGEVNMALKQKSDIEHYRNKLRLKAKRKGYYDIPLAEGNASSKSQTQESDNAEHTPATRPSSRTPEYDDERSSTYVKSRRRHSEVKYPAYRSRQSLNSPSPGGTEMDLLVMRERPRKGIRNSGYDTEPEIIEETNVDSLAARRQFGYGKQVKGQSETSTLSSQPSIDEVRQQMHLLLEEAFSLASAGHTSSSRRNPYHQQHQALSPYGPGPSIPYPEEATSAPDTMNHAQRGLQWVPAYGHDLYQCSLGKPTFRFTQLPEMVTDSPPPPVPPRTGPAPRSSLQRSPSDLGPKAHSSESPVPDMQQSQQDSSTYVPVSRAPLPPVTTEPVPNHSGNPMTAVYAIPTSRPGYPGYFISTPPSSYHSPSWMSYPPEPEDVSSPWTES